MTSDRTLVVVQQQTQAMGCDLFEVGVYRPEAPGVDARMLLRVWDWPRLLRSMPWLRFENRQGRHIYIRPKGEHRLSLVDDLTADAIAAMKREGFHPAVVVETSPANFQAWLKHPEQLDREMSTAAARTLAERFVGDTGAADWRHFGRLVGFVNRKDRHMNVVTGLYPFVRLIEAEGRVYPEATRFLDGVRREVEERLSERERQRLRASAAPDGPSKTIESFRSDPRYTSDGNRIDLAYALYALSHGATEEQVAAEIRTRELTKKGSERRQEQYVARTIRKAARGLERDRGR
jgi:hypothetical protein